MKCPFCNQPVDLDDDQNYHEVVSWVNGPKMDGPKLREQTGRVAHKLCIELLVQGQAPDQPSMFDEPDNRCTAQTPKGICDEVLTPQGDCVKGEDHLF